MFLRHRSDTVRIERSARRLFVANMKKPPAFGSEEGLFYDPSLPTAASLLRGNHLAGRRRLARVEPYSGCTCKVLQLGRKVYRRTPTDSNAHSQTLNATVTIHYG
jgi:hypothetical protein